MELKMYIIPTKVVFNLELYSGHSLAIEGTKKVKYMAQSISATTHSYTIPTISVDGRLLSPLFIVLKEPTGSFGPKVQELMFRERNIFVLASQSGKLTSHHFEIWLKEVYFPNVPKSVLLLDSWTGHCPDVITRNKPENFCRRFCFPNSSRNNGSKTTIRCI